MEEMKDTYEHGGGGRGWQHGDEKAMLWHVVRKAKMELLKDKIKKKLEATEGKKLDEMADMLVGAHMEMRKARREFWRKKMEMKEKMMEFFTEGDAEESEG
jgi:hypothetical protein